jgi:hypothetical protein
MPVAHRYREMVRIEDNLRPTLNEDWVQRLWFEQLVHNPLRTQGGQEVEILQAGLWNRGPGPDFTQVALKINGEVVTGDVEIHLKPSDWNAHGHQGDPAYDRVMVHLVWESGSYSQKVKTSQGRVIPEIELSSQLSAPLPALHTLFTTSAQEQAVGARVGACRKALDRMSPATRLDFLLEAGRFRFSRRVQLWGARIHRSGYDQSLWLGLADALGYSRNRSPFRCLAQRLPLKRLQSKRDDLDREALLYGNAGFLPQASLPVGAAGDWAGQLWQRWWKLRDESPLPAVAGWELRGLRPANRPERRLAVLSVLSGKGRWKQFRLLCQQGAPGPLQEFLTRLEHEYWQRHATLGGARMAKAMALMGKSRVESFLFNVVWPLGVAGGNEKILKWVESEKTGESMLPARIASVRLLGEKMPREARRVLVQEGLIQIYQDFCLQEFDACRQCEFPELVAQFKKS